MTKDEFEQGFASRSGMTVDNLHAKGLGAVRCHCDYDNCKGWAIADVQPIVIIKAGDPDGQSPVLVDWCKEQGIEPNDTYQLAFDLTAMIVTVYQHEWDSESRSWVAREAFTRPITTLPLVKAVQQARQ